MFRRVAISASLNVFPHLFSASLFSCFLAELTATTVSTVSSLPLLSGNKVCFCYTRFLFLLLLFLNAPILTCRHISPPPLWSLPICPQDRPQPQSPSRLLSHSSPGIGGVRKRINRTGASRYLLLTWVDNITHLAHCAQSVGLLAGGGLVAPGDGGVGEPVRPRHHLDLLCLAHQMQPVVFAQPFVASIFSLPSLPHTVLHLFLDRACCCVSSLMISEMSRKSWNLQLCLWPFMTSPA